MVKVTAQTPVAGLGPARVFSSASARSLQMIRPKRRVLAQDHVRRSYFPDVVLTDHEEKSMRFYDDLIKDKFVLINFMYAGCDQACPRVTQNLVKVQELLADSMGRDIFFYSVTLDPAHDTPKILNEYAKRHGVGPGWTFLTGYPADVELLRCSLGFMKPDPALDREKENHVTHVRYGNEARQMWSACPGTSHPEFIVKAFSWVGWPAKPDLQPRCNRQTSAQPDVI